MVFIADTWALGEDREIWTGLGFCPEETSSVPVCQWFQACPWTRITGVINVTLKSVSGFFLLVALALLFAVMAMLVSALLLLSVSESSLAGESTVAGSQLLGKDAMSAQAPPHFCLASPFDPSELPFEQKSWIGTCLVRAQTSRLGLVTPAAVQLRPL